MTPMRAEGPRARRQVPAAATHGSTSSSLPHARTSTTFSSVGFPATRLPMYRPPRSRAGTAAQAILENEVDGWTYLTPQFAHHGLDPESPSFGGELDSNSVGLMRRRVVPPPRYDYGLPHDLLDPEQEGGEDMYTGGLNSGTSFTDLLGSQIEESQEPPHQTEPSIDYSPTIAKGSQGRTKNFRDEEDKLLVSAWLNVGMDPIQGVDQSNLAYWARIHEYYHGNKTFESVRTQGSLSNRWSSIQHDVNLFCGCVSRIEQRNQSGCSVDDKITSACTLFKEEDKKKRNFAYMHCWKILKDKPKWMERRKQLEDAKRPSTKKQKTGPHSSPSSALGASGGAEPLEQVVTRPDGRKKEKQRLRQHSTIDAIDYLMDRKQEVDDDKERKKEEKKSKRCTKAFALQEEKLKLDREKFEYQK